MALRPPSTSPAIPADPRELAQSDGFIREVDDALRQDEAIDLYKRYGKPVGAAVLLALAVFAGYLIWDHYRQAGLATRAEKFTLALDQLESGGLDSATKAVAPLAASGGDGSQAAAKMLQAGIAEQQGKAADAVKAFDAVAADSTAPQPYRDLATIRSVALRFDTLPPATVVTLLKPLAVPGKPWFGSAGELLGLAYIRQGNNKLAGPLFAAISRDKTAPDSLRRRTRQMAGLLGVDAIDDVNEAVASNGGGNSGANGPAQAAH